MRCEIIPLRLKSYVAFPRPLPPTAQPYSPADQRKQPCHRCIASTGYIGGFLGDWRDAPSGINMEKKLALLKGEGVLFDVKGKLVDQGRWWGDFKV